MTKSLKKQFAELEANAGKDTKNALGPVLASISISAPLTYRYEYAIYIRRYGPPLNGIFDPIYLTLIRAELAAGIVP
jgi:hypothetical protein